MTTRRLLTVLHSTAAGVAAPLDQYAPSYPRLAGPTILESGARRTTVESYNVGPDGAAPVPTPVMQALVIDTTVETLSITGRFTALPRRATDPAEFFLPGGVPAAFSIFEIFEGGRFSAQISAAFAASVPPDTTVQITVNVGGKTYDGDPAIVGVLTVNVTGTQGGAPPNTPPVLARQPGDQAFTQGVAFNFQLPADTFFDANGDTLTYTALRGSGAALPSWLVFNAATLAFSAAAGAPVAAVGTLTIDVRAFDGGAQGNGFARFSLTITAAAGGSVPLEADPDAGIVYGHGVEDALKLVPHTDGAGATIPTHWTRDTGNWSSPNTWSQGTVPGDGSKVVIQSAHTVTFNAANSGRLASLRVNGVFKASTVASTQLNVEHFVVAPSGAYRAGTIAAPLPAGVTHTVMFIDTGDLDVATDIAGIGRGLMKCGLVEIHGAVKSYFHRGATKAGPLVGATTMSLSVAPKGWRAGDRVVIRGTKAPPAGQPDGDVGENNNFDPVYFDDVVTLSADPAGAALTWTGGLVNDHDGVTLDGVDKTCFVDNLSRNIAFKSENAATFRRGHVITMMTATGYVKHARYRDLGRTDKNTTEFGVKDGSQFVPRTPTDNIRGRYSEHLHHTMADFVFEGCALEGSPGWLFSHHGGGFHTIKGNVGYNSFASNFVAEDGDEMGVWEENSGGRTDGKHSILKNIARAANNAFRQGAVFGWQSRNILDLNNRAADFGGGYGSAFFTRNGFLVPRARQWVPVPFYLMSSEQNDNIPIRSFGFEAASGFRGLEIVKGGPVQKSAARTVLADHAYWGVRDGAEMTYTGHYNVFRMKIDATREGIHHGKNNADFSYIDCHLQNAATGFRRTARSGNTTNFQTVDLGLFLVNMTFANCAVNFNTLDPEDRVLPSQPFVAPTFDYGAIPFPGEEAGTIPVSATITDSLGAYVFPQPWEALQLYTGTQIGWANSAAAERGWYDYAGAKVTVYPFHFAGRDETAQRVKDLVIAIDVNLHNNLDTASRGVYNPAAPIFG